MVGIPGSGKSFFAENFAVTFNAPFVSFEKIATQMFDNKIINSSDQATVDRLSSYLLEQLLKTGQTIVYEGISGNRTTRQELAKIARDKGYAPLFVWVQTESATAKARTIKPRPGKTVLSSDEFDSTLRRFTPPSAIEKAVVISGKHTYASQLRIVLKRLVVARINKVEASPVPRIEGRRVAIR